MEQLTIVFDDAQFDALVHHKDALLDTGKVTIAFKDSATKGGRPAAVISFVVLERNGNMARAQTVVTARLLRTLMTAIDGRYPNLLEGD